MIDLVLAQPAVFGLGAAAGVLVCVLVPAVYHAASAMLARAAAKAKAVEAEAVAAVKSVEAKVEAMTGTVHQRINVLEADVAALKAKLP